MGWQWHQLDHMQIICTSSLQTDNHASTLSVSFYKPDALPDAQPTASKHWRQRSRVDCGGCAPWADEAQDLRPMRYCSTSDCVTIPVTSSLDSSMTTSWFDWTTTNTGGHSVNQSTSQSPPSKPPSTGEPTAAFYIHSQTAVVVDLLT